MTGKDQPPTPVADRFFKCVAERGNHPALIINGEAISYAELGLRAARIAIGIQAFTGNDDRPIAVLARRPAVAIPAMLAAMAAGKTYLVLDPHDASERFEYQLQHSTAEIIVTDSEHAVQAESWGFRILNTDEFSDGPGSFTPPKSAGPAYLLYTSGSTGAPKGVVQTQANLVNKAAVLLETLGVVPEDRLSLLFSPTTGASTSDIYGALLNGATVVPFDLQAEGLQGLPGWLEEATPTIVHTLPTVFRRFLETVDRDSVYPNVRTIVLTGESVLQSDLELFRKHFRSGTKLVHRLSASETGGIAYLEIDSSTVVSDEILPVGFPMPGRTLHLVDEEGNEVEPGEKGEIVVESEFLALGYWRDPELTAAAFTDRDGRRMYRTGDIARRQIDGRLEFLGRRAGRLKIAGHTIETREVERALQSVGSFKELVVVGREAVPGHPEMAAFYVPAEGGPSWDEASSRTLAERVPPHLIPSRFIELGTLPLTSLGKIDRDALPWPSSVDRDRHAYVEPRTETERVLGDIWQSVFGAVEIGIHDDFFALGGTSIQAFSVFALLARRLGVDLAPTTIAEAPTIEQLAALIAAQADGEERRWEHIVPLRPEGSGPAMFCLHGGEGYTLSFRKLIPRLDPSRPVYGLDAETLDGTRLPLRRVEDIASHYLAEIRSIQPHGPYILIGYSFGGTVGFEIAQQLARAGEKAQLLLLDAVRSGRSMRSSRRRQRGRYLRSVWLGLRRAGARARGSNVDLAGRSARRLAIEVPLRLMIDLIPRGLLRRFCDHRLQRGRPVPHVARQPYYFDLHSEASLRYEPDTYPGPVTIISARGESETRRREWEPIVEGQLTITEVDCEHMEMFLEPHVTVLGSEIQRALNPPLS